MLKSKFSIRNLRTTNTTISWGRRAERSDCQNAPRIKTRHFEHAEITLTTRVSIDFSTPKHGYHGRLAGPDQQIKDVHDVERNASQAQVPRNEHYQS